jgi:hypothetical protein
MRRSASLALATALTLVPAAAMADSHSTPSAEVTTSSAQAPARTPASHTDAASYAQREQKDQQKVANYEGGSVVVIGVSGGALVVLLILLLILL